MFDIGKAEDLLDKLLGEHSSIMEEAQGFGLRMAAIPKGLMPIKEAQQVLVELGKNVEKINAFYMGLLNVRDVPKEMADGFQALVDKASKATKKCEDDKKKAVAALAAHEDLLVGEAFQEMFQAVRLAVIDFDVMDDVDLDFDTTLYLDAEPAYAVGTVHVKKGTSEVYTVQVGYRASDELFYGNITATKRYKTFKEVVKKNGRTKLPAFVRDLTEQLKALADQDAAGVFKSRKKIELTLVDSDAVRAMLKPLVEAEIKKQLGSNPPSVVFSATVASSGTSATGTLQGFSGWGWTDELSSEADARSKLRFFTTKQKALSAAFSITLPNGHVWDVVPTVGNWTYVTTYKKRSSWPERVLFTEATMSEQWPIEWSDKAATALSLPELQARATLLKVAFDPKSKNKSTLITALRAVSPKPKGLAIDSSPVTYALTRKSTGKKAAVERVSTLFLSRIAGATGFSVYQEGADARRAFREAVSNAQHEHGHDTYSGTIGAVSSFGVARNEPFPVQKSSYGGVQFSQELNNYIDKNMDKYDKWDGCGAVPVSVEQVLAKDTVTVTVEAKDEVEARRKGILLIKATGRVPPKASIVVEVPEGTKGLTLENKGARVSTWKVMGLRKQSLVGAITGWVFFGWAPS